MNENRLFEFIMLFMMCVLFLAMGFLVLMLIDSFTLKEVGVEKVPCVDKHGRPFENELCEKKMYCTKWGFGNLYDSKCGDVRIPSEVRK